MSTVYTRSLWPLFDREWRAQMQRRRTGALGAYPGLFWAFLPLSLPLIMLALNRLGHLSPGDDPAFGVAPSYTLAGLWLLWLSCLRACMGSAISMAEEARNHTLASLRQLPGSGGVFGLMAAKTLVILAPLLVEWALFLLLTVVVQIFDGSVEFNPGQVLGVAAAAVPFFVALGMWLGVRLGDPDRAGGNARVAVVMTMVGWGLLESVLKGPMLWIGLLIWLGLMFRSSARLAYLMQGMVTGCLLILMLPRGGEFCLYELSPLSAAVHPQLTGQNCLFYLGAAGLLTLWNYHQLRRL